MSKATPSNLEFNSIDEEYQEFMEELADEEFEVSFDEHLLSSDGDVVSFTKFVKDIFVSLIPDDEDPEEEEDLLEYPGEIIPVEYSDSPFLLAAPGDRSVTYPDNVIVYSGVFNSGDTVLYLPAEFQDDVSVVNGKLFNISNSNIYGRLHDFDLTDTTPSIYYLTPAVGAPTNVYNYGSFNYSRDYYVSQGRLTYDTVYGDFTVNDVQNFSSTDWTYKSYLTNLVYVALMGVFLLCLLKKSKRY